MCSISLRPVTALSTYGLFAESRAIPADCTVSTWAHIAASVSHCLAAACIKSPDEREKHFRAAPDFAENSVIYFLLGLFKGVNQSQNVQGAHGTKIYIYN